MQAALNLPKTLSLAQLKSLALTCGVASSGTKAQLVQRLEASAHSLARHRVDSTLNRRVLSIDMGIRNLAFAYLNLSPVNADRSNSGIRTPLPGVVVKSWDHVVLADPATASSTAAEEGIWSPSSMATMTLNLVKHNLLGFEEPPTHILIERQRFRSGGAAAVQEWTLRVNTLEAMIYSTLRTLKSCGQWDGEIIPISPKRVGPFWLEGLSAEDASEIDDDTKPKSRKVANAKHKKAKIDLVAKWLLEGKINLSGQTEAVAESYLQRWRGRRPKKNGDGEAEPANERLRKLDDLADSLLQGLAWIQWQDNIKLLGREGPGALL
jgi:cruciform cutting endonuclease 1